ncbi:MAG: NUDIX hydrolase [Thermoprotei archaeon]|nr:MAG: NUDIX hydrolase [Thermoprotei archaeon]
MSFSRIVVGVGAVLLHNDKILLVKRKHSPCAGYWAIPGGRVEYGEPLYSAVERELFEETGVRAKPIGVVWVAEIPPGTCKDQVDGEHFVLIDFLMEAQEPITVKPGTDAIVADFYKLSNPPEPLTPITKALIKYLRIISKRGELYTRLIPAKWWEAFA